MASGDKAVALMKKSDGSWSIDGLDSKLDADLVRGKKIYDLGRHKKICKFDMEQESGKGNLQGICVVDNYLYAHKNVKDNDNGVTSYSPDEKGRIYKFDLDGNLIKKTDDLDKVAHEGFAYYKDSDGNLKLVCSGGTDDGEENTTIKTYIYEDKETYINAGKKISIVNWDDSDSPSIDRYRVMDDYDADNEKDTQWYHSVPTVDPDGGNFIVAFTNPKNTRQKLIRVYNHIDDIINGNYNTPVKEFTISRETDVNSYYAFQGISHKNGFIYILFGEAESTHIRNREILVYDIDGNFIKNVKWSVNFLDLNKYKFTEPEGIIFDKNDNIFVGLNCKDSDDNYEDYLVQFDTGDPAKIIKENQPYSPYISAAINIFTKKDTWFRLWDWDEDNNEANNLLSITDYGNIRQSGNYLGILYNPKNSQDFNKCISYSLEYDILQLRAWTDLDTGGAGINLYKKGNDSSSNAGGITFFKDSNGNYVFNDVPTSDPSVKNALWNDGGTLKLSDG